MSGTPEEVVLSVQGVTKRFGAFTALDDVSLEVRDGEVVGLIGENGAGKSTLLNVLCGALPPDAGSLRLHGREYAPRSYKEAMEAGLFRVYQEPAFVPTVSVAENMVLGFEQRFTRFGVIDRRRVRRAVADALEPLEGLVDPSLPMSRCDANTQQAIEILRALLASRMMGVERPVVLLDEPTAALIGHEVAVLFQILDRLRGQAAFVFVSHRLVEIQRECNRSYVLKDGRLVAEVGRGVPESQLHSLMVGRERADDYYLESRQQPPGERVVLEVAGLSGPRFNDVDLRVHAGEIVGLAGVVGSGKEELGKVLAGAVHRADGKIEAKGRSQPRDLPHARLRVGVGYVPHDRQAESVIGPFPLTWNMSLSSLTLGALGTGPAISVGAEKRAAERWMKRLSVRARSSGSLMSSLSGGNQQKVVIGRVLQAGADVLVLDNPTRGIDAGAKSEIFALLRELAQDGLAIVLISDDLSELIGLSHRIVVLKDGVTTSEIEAPVGAKPSEETLIAAMV